MSTKIDIQPSSDRELVISCLMNAPRDKVYQAWTQPELLKKWFAPHPWMIAHAENDVRAGGYSAVVMRSPEGQEFPANGVFLEVIPNEKIVFTDAYTKSWQPSAKPFMTVTITFENEQGKTRYTARALHWSIEDRIAHEKMGFHKGWSQCADQLEALAASL